MRGAAKLLAAVAVLVFCGTVARAQQEAAGAVQSHSSCAAISQGDRRLEPVSKLCEFARQYRHSLPNFICEQRTISSANWVGGPAERTTDSQITYRNGEEVRSNNRVNGAPADDAEVRTMVFRTRGEFGGELVDLFATTVKPRFRYEKTARIRGVEALEFSVRLSREDNLSWTVSYRAKTILPEFRGTFWVQAGSAKLLRFEIEPIHLPRDFPIESARSRTEYHDVAIREVGIHLLPIHSDTRACLRTKKTGVRASMTECIFNTVDFDGCRKFAADHKIVLP